MTYRVSICLELIFVFSLKWWLNLMWVTTFCVAPSVWQFFFYTLIWHLIRSLNNILYSFYRSLLLDSVFYSLVKLSTSVLTLFYLTCMHAKLLQLCLTLWNPVDCSLPGSSVHVILHARILEWVATRGSSRPKDGTLVSYISFIVRQVLYL